MNELIAVGRIRYRRSRAQWFYWLKVLGVDDQKPDIWQSLYALYLLAIVCGWVVLSWAGIVSIAHHLGGPVSALWLNRLPLIFSLVAILVVTWQVARIPLRLGHGDLEWLAPSPISRRIPVLFDLIPKQAVRLMMITLIGSVLASAIHAPQYLGLGLLVGLWWLAMESFGYAASLWRASRPRGPLPSLWIAVLLGLVGLLSVLRAPMVWPSHFVILPLTEHAWQTAFMGVGAWLIAGWLAIWLAAPSVHMLTIQKGSVLYADIRGLGTRYAPNPGLVQELRQKAVLSRRRPWGRLPEGSSRWWELGRWFWSMVRMPGQILRFFELSLFLRAGLLLASDRRISLAWLIWVFVAYWFRRASLSRWFRTDVGDPFIRQFWPDTLAHRLVWSTLHPLLWVLAIAVSAWVILPAGTEFTLTHLLFLIGLAVSWWLGEAVLIIRQIDNDGRTDGAHLGSVVAVGAMMFVGAQLHHPGAALAVPIILLLWFFGQWQTGSAS